MTPYRPPAPMSCQQVRELEARLIRDFRAPSLLLMENAAQAVAQVACDAMGQVAGRRVVVLAGPGNNGGDGLAAARLLTVAGATTTVLLSGRAEQLRGDARTNFEIYQALGGAFFEFAGMAADGQQLDRQFAGCDLVLDALLGSGARGDPRGNIAQLIQAANAARVEHRIAVDIPSGLDADTGRVGTPCFVASATVTFVAAKLGFSELSARRVLGAVMVASIGIPLGRLAGRSPGTAGENFFSRPLDS